MSNVALTYWQAGLESTPGTPVAATRKIYETGEIPEEEAPKEYVEQARQSFIQNFDAVETHKLLKWKMETPILNYNDVVFWNALALKGGVVPSGAGPYVRTYNGAATSDDLKAATFEVTDGVGTFQIPYTLCDGFEIKGSGGNNKAGVVSAKWDLISQKLTPGHTMTAAIADRDLRGGFIPFAQTAFYLDDAHGDIGTTEIGTLMEFSIKGKNGMTPIFFGNDSGYFGAHTRAERHLEIMLKLKFDSTAYTEFQTNFRSNVGRYGQIKMTNGTHTWLWNFYTKFETFKFPNDGPTRTVALMGKTIYDADLGYDWQSVLTNGTSGTF